MSIDVQNFADMKNYTILLVSSTQTYELII